MEHEQTPLPVSMWGYSAVVCGCGLDGYQEKIGSAGKEKIEGN